MHEAILEPRLAVNRLFLQRAVDRGEISADRDIELLARVASGMAAFRMLVEQKPLDAEYLTSLIDHVILPAAGIAPEARTA